MWVCLQAVGAVHDLEALDGPEVGGERVAQSVKRAGPLRLRAGARARRDDGKVRVQASAGGHQGQAEEESVGTRLESNSLREKHACNLLGLQHGVAWRVLAAKVGTWHGHPGEHEDVLRELLEADGFGEGNVVCRDVERLSKNEVLADAREILVLVALIGPVLWDQSEEVLEGVDRDGILAGRDRLRGDVRRVLILRYVVRLSYINGVRLVEFGPIRTLNEATLAAARDGFWSILADAPQCREVVEASIRALAVARRVGARLQFAGLGVSFGPGAFAGRGASHQGDCQQECSQEGALHVGPRRETMSWSRLPGGECKHGLKGDLGLVSFARTEDLQSACLAD